MSSENEKLIGELRAIAGAARRPDGTHCPLSETIDRAADALVAAEALIAKLETERRRLAEVANEAISVDPIAEVKAIVDLADQMHVAALATRSRRRSQNGRDDG